MATVKEINHDGSTTLSDHYTTTITDPDGAATVIPGAALSGSTNGVNIDFDAGTNFITLEEDFTALTGTDFRWRFRLDFSNMAWTGAGASTLVQFFLRAGASDVFRIVWQRTISVLRIASLAYYSDSGGITVLGGSINFPDSGDTCVELRGIRETADGNVDGEVELFINGISQASHSNLDNFIRFNLGISRFRLQWGSGDADDTGNLYYDEMILDNVGTADLGCNVFTGYNLVQGGGLP